MRTFLIEHKVSALTLEDFEEIEVAYQEAHGKPIKWTEKSKKTHQQSANRRFILNSDLENIIGKDLVQFEALPVAKR